jgi:uncharacterized membrane protein
LAAQKQEIPLEKEEKNKNLRRNKMDKIITVIFGNEEDAFRGVHALEDLHRDGSITLYASGIVKRQFDGRVTVLQEAPDGPLGTGVGLLIGALVGLVGGPVGVAVGGAVGAGGGMFYDLARLGVSEDYLYEVGHKLLPGMTAVVAEVWEEWMMPVDMRMETFGGVVFRRARQEALDTKFERDAAEFDAEIDELEAEIKTANAETKAKLQAKLDNAKAKLRETQERAKKAAEQAKQETDAKVQSLQDQISKANAERKAKMEKWIAEMKENHKKRTEKLRQAWEKVKEAAAI